MAASSPATHDFTAHSHPDRQLHADAFATLEPDSTPDRIWS
jgi:hypothetical protein